MENLKFQSFQPLIGTEFKVAIGEEEYISLQLIEAEEKNTLRSEAFSLIFTGPKEIILNQMIHQFTNKQLGVFEMFITPIQSNDLKEIHYQAVFNRLKA
jgi:hypothetical protein